MLLSKLQRYVLLGVVSLVIVGAVVLGANHLAQSQEESDNPDDQVLKQEVIHPGTKIVVEQWCPNCQEMLRPEVPDLLSHLQGFGQQEVEDYLRAEFPGASLLSFDPDQILIQLPPGYCDRCSVWPEKGYIGLDDDKQIAIYYEDGTFFQTYGPAPGSWLDDLEVGIQFESAEECEQWLINLTS